MKKRKFFKFCKISKLLFSISPELEAKTQEVIHNKYGGREKAEKAARVIQGQLKNLYNDALKQFISNVLYIYFYIFL